MLKWLCIFILGAAVLCQYTQIEILKKLALAHNELILYLLDAVKIWF